MTGQVPAAIDAMLGHVVIDEAVSIGDDLTIAHRTTDDTPMHVFVVNVRRLLLLTGFSCEDASAFHPEAQKDLIAPFSW